MFPLISFPASSSVVGTTHRWGWGKEGREKKLVKLASLSSFGGYTFLLSMPGFLSLFLYLCLPEQSHLSLADHVSCNQLFISCVYRCIYIMLTEQSLQSLSCTPFHQYREKCTCTTGACRTQKMSSMSG